MTEIAVVGDEEFSLGFKLAGIVRFYDVAEGVEEAFFRAVSDPRIGILVTDDRFYSSMSAKLRAKCDTSNQPVVVVLGGGKGDALREQIKRTVGVDLWKN